MSTCRKIILLFCCINYFINFAIAQGKFNNNWVTGVTFAYRINFDSTVPKVTWLIDSNASNDFNYSGAHSCISDSNGNLLLLCTGAKVFNKYGRLIKNGDTLINKKQYLYFNGKGNIYNSQGSVIILPFDSGIYKMINVTYSDSMFGNGGGFLLPNNLYMHTVDIHANNDSGAVIIKKEFISDQLWLGSTGMTACKHANGKDWWLIKQGSDSNIFYNYIIKKDSVIGPIVSYFAEPNYTIYDRSGQMALTLDATKIANTQEQPNQVFVASFDRCYGTVGNPKTYNIPALLVDSFFSTTQLETLPRGLCFSPNGQFLYVIMRSKIFQLDLAEPDSAKAWYLVSSLDTLPAYFNQYNTAYLAPNNKIYIGRWGNSDSTFNVINNPDNKGSLSNFCKRCLRFKMFGVSGLPNQINYNLGVISPPCYPLDTGNIIKDSIELNVSYEPISKQLAISIAKNTATQLRVFDVQGALVYSQNINIGEVKINMNTGSWASGVYIVKVGGQSKKVIVE